MPIAPGRNPVRQLKRYRQIGSVFARHGFGFIWNQLEPVVRARLGKRPEAAPELPAEALAEHFRLALEELGPTFVKLGQVLSTRPDLLPPAYIAELSRLQDNVPPVPWEEIRATLTREYDRQPEEVFAMIDPVSMASASLSQVHAATLRDGTEVVVKIQRSNIRETIETDLSIMGDLAFGAQHTPLGRIYDLPAIVDDFAYTLRNELDYRREGRNADRFRENFKQEPRLYIPRVYWAYSTQNVLVFERIYGVKIDDVDAMEAAGIDRKAVAFNSAQIIVKEVLVDGFFHADPHPGNFLVMPGAVIGAMDFGMVGYLDKRLRVDLIRLYAASVEMDEDAVVEQLIRMGAVGEDAERRGLARDIQRLLNKYRGMSLKEVRATEVVTDIMPVAFRHHLRLPTDLWLLGKTLGMMEGIGLQLDPDFDMFAVSEPIVRRLLLRLMLPDSSWPRDAMIMGQEWVDVATLLPKATRRVLQQAEQGELFSLSIKETDRALRLLDRLATRLAVSILIAALTIGLAFLLPSTSGHFLARAVTVAGFAISAMMGAWLIFSMWRSRRHQ